MSDSATAVDHAWPAKAEAGLQNKLFGYLFEWLFKGLVYPQIWEDPEIDLEALQITPDSRVVAIASGGCNILSYLIANPAKITALDLSRAHIALNRLKLVAARHLPSADLFYRFFGDADEEANVAAYWRFLAPRLDAESRAYWERRGFGLRRRRISLFSRNVYRHGLLGRFIGFAHMLARIYGIDPRDVLRARSLGRAAQLFRQCAGAAVRQAAHPLADVTKNFAVRSWHPGRAVSRARWR